MGEGIFDFVFVTAHLKDLSHVKVKICYDITHHITVFVCPSRHMVGWRSPRSCNTQLELVGTSSLFPKIGCSKKLTAF